MTLRGISLLRDPHLNKSTAYSEAEREALGLVGLVPEGIDSEDTQIKRALLQLGQKPTDPHGNYDGWVCPCHGSQYDSSGRIRQGPAPKNLLVPPYKYASNTKVTVG